MTPGLASGINLRCGSLLVAILYRRHSHYMKPGIFTRKIPLQVKFASVGGRQNSALARQYL